MKAFDIEFLRRYTFEDPALEKELLELFKAQLPILVEQIETATSQSEWHLATHTLKGSARSVGAPALGEYALELEQMGIQADPRRAKLVLRLKDLVAAFSKAVERVYPSA